MIFLIILFNIIPELEKETIRNQQYLKINLYLQIILNIMKIIPKVGYFIA